MHIKDRFLRMQGISCASVGVCKADGGSAGVPSAFGFSNEDHGYRHNNEFSIALIPEDFPRDRRRFPASNSV